MSQPGKLPPPIADALRGETQGEVVRWHGRPDPSRAFWGALPIWLMGIPWTAFSGALLVGMVASLVYGEAKKVKAGTIDAWLPAMGWIGALFIVPFVLVGLGLLASPFIARSRARRTVYALTDRRLLTITVGRTSKVTAIDVAAVKEIERREHRDGSGSLKLVMGYGRDSEGDAVEKKHELNAIPDVAAVARLIDDLRRRT